ncbi:hypothetical protein EAH_00039900 [Eimeria acervulina]|uniref:Uncharacterized protein n=1 Tax=Eimeria acervulina TaxID=5801 RepID=U6GVE0_EIMAC|nr:hypothetical protein EAH_00039900 [Eimeria acervulina]CDI83532.1 hypothetical protein EAH_00039900 [Eimeria acervulina]
MLPLAWEKVASRKQCSAGEQASAKHLIKHSYCVVTACASGVRFLASNLEGVLKSKDAAFHSLIAGCVLQHLRMLSEVSQEEFMAYPYILSYRKAEPCEP